MMFTIEPMINAGKREIREAGDGWTIVTRDRSLSAQWEHTVLVTDTGYEVMTLSAGSPPPPAFVAGVADGARGVNTRDPIGRSRGAGRRRDAAPARAPAELRARFRDGKAARLAHFLAARPTARAALRLLRALADDVDDDACRRSGATRHAGRRRAGRRRRLRPRRAVPALRRRRAGAAAVGDAHGADEARGAAIERFITACWDTGLEIGSSVRTVDECVAMALADVTVQTALLESRFLCGARKRVQRRSERATAEAMDAEGVPARQDARDAPAPPEVREHALLARAQLQGEPGRPARPADRDLGRARRRPRPHLAASSPRTA